MHNDATGWSRGKRSQASYNPKKCTRHRTVRRTHWYHLNWIFETAIYCNLSLFWRQRKSHICRTSKKKTWTILSILEHSELKWDGGGQATAEDYCCRCICCWPLWVKGNTAIWGPGRIVQYYWSQARCLRWKLARRVPTEKHLLSKVRSGLNLSNIQRK